MIFRFLFLPLLVLILVGFFSLAGDQSLLSDWEQVTFEGYSSGEGYFNPQGSQMIFQSRKQIHEPYQIYLKDLKTGKVKLISTGKGKTTCAWLHPENEKALYASTHESPSPQKAPQKRGGAYAWDYDPHYDIFETSLTNPSQLKNLTNTLGYDAEGAYSPDGKWIVFASNRRAYRGKLKKKEQALLKRNPSYFMDIYLMDSQGKNVRRLTTQKGYDGGPFFSPDGTKIVWRRFGRRGRQAEIYTMNVNGTEQRKITNLKTTSWAPFYHPSGDYIVFATSVHGHKNFELYVVDSQGKQPPLRITDSPGFDGLPVFHPDGKHLYWSHQMKSGQVQIFKAKWNDSLLRKKLKIQKKVTNLSPEIKKKDIHKWITYLSSWALKGRGTASPEEKIYTQELSHWMKKMGLKPFSQKGSYQQPFDFIAERKPTSKNKLSFFLENGDSFEWKLGENWKPLAVGDEPLVKAPMVFAGFGLSVPPTSQIKGYDSYIHLDVKDKWVLIVDGLPEGLTPEERAHFHFYTHLSKRALVVRQKGALGLIVGGRGFYYKDKATLPLKWPLIFLQEPLLRELLEVDERTLEEALKGVGFQMKLSLKAHLEFKEKRKTAHNVLGLLQVPGASKTLVVGAHGDHLGEGLPTSSLANPKEGGTLIHFGADDNASGVSAVMEIAHFLSHKMKKGWRPKQNILFAIWSGEELGTLGSSHFVKKAKTKEISAYVNMDMIGRLEKHLNIQGIGSSSDWESFLQKLSHNLSVKTQKDPYLPTDALSFYTGGVPVISFFTGAHKDYHTPRDRASRINEKGLNDITHLIAQLVEDIASQSQGLKYEKIKKPPRKGRGFKVYLGTIPDYSSEEEGVLLSGVREDSPAEKGGLKRGDLIVQVGDIPIKNVYDFTYALSTLKAGEPVTIKVLRQDHTLSKVVTPQAR